MSPSIGRNAPCPCGSGKKYKKCCLVGIPPIGSSSAGGTMPYSNKSEKSLMLSHAVRYLEEANKWIRTMQSAESVELALQLIDKAYSRLNPQNYSVVISEMTETEFPLLFLMDPVLRINLCQEALDISKLRAMAADVTERCLKSQCQGVMVNVDVRAMDQGKLWDVLISREYSFDLRGANSTLTVILRQHSESEDAYMPQYVDGHLIYSSSLKGGIEMPFVGFSNPDRQAFQNSYSFVHELIHVIQRVFRRERVPCYDYGSKSGKKQCRNMEHRIALGVQDELEVQVIMAKAYPKYVYNLRATLAHIENLLKNSEEYDAFYFKQMVTEALGMIEFDKYQPPDQENVEKAVRSAFDLRLTG